MTRTAILALLLAGCGGPASTATSATYATTVADCVRRERAIIDRQGTTEEQDRADLARERALCDQRLHDVETGGH